MAVNRNIRIMIVDDYATMLRILRNLLKQLEFGNVDDASDGEDALRKLKTNGPYDLIISDWNMQPMTGIEFLKQVRADDKIKHIPFIMITAERKAEDVVAAKQGGVPTYGVKPCNAEPLETKMSSGLGPI